MRRSSLLCFSFLFSVISASTNWTTSSSLPLGSSLSFSSAISSLLFDPVSTNLYFAGGSTVGEIRTSDFTLQNSYTANTSSSSSVFLVLDTSNDYLYAVQSTGLGHAGATRIDLQDWSNVAAQEFVSSDFSLVSAAAIDTSTQTLWVSGFSTGGNAFVFVNLTALFEFTNQSSWSYPTEIGAPGAITQQFTAAIFDLSSELLFAATNTTLYVIDLTQPKETNVIDSILLPWNSTQGVVPDWGRNLLYFYSGSTFTNTTLFVVSTVNFTIVNSLTLSPNEVVPKGIDIDTVRGQIYLGFGTQPSIVSHIFLSNFSDDSKNIWTGTKQVDIGLTEIAFDTVNVWLYVSLSLNGVQSVLRLGVPEPCPNDDCANETRGQCFLGVCDCNVPVNETLYPGSPGYSGPGCAFVECQNNCFANNSQGQCQGNGVCVCSDIYTGDDCSTRQCPAACTGEGTCDESTWTCTCNPGWSGQACNIYSTTGPCDTLTSCSACATNSSCGWCDTTSTCVPGDILGPADGGCLQYLYQDCPEYGILFWAYLFTAFAAFMLLVDMISITVDDMDQPYGKPTDQQLRQTWWRNQRSAKTWVLYTLASLLFFVILASLRLLIEEIQFAAIVSQFAVNPPSILSSFLNIFRWAVIAFPLPWNEDVGSNAHSRSLLSLEQFSYSTLSFPDTLLYGQLFWLAVLLLLALGVMGIFALVSLCHPNENLKKFVRLRLVYMLLRIALFAYFPLVVTASYSIYLLELGTIIVGAITLAALGLGLPVYVWWRIPRASTKDVKERAKIFETQFIMQYGCLFIPYQFRQSWYTLVILTRKLAIGLIVGFLAGQELAQIIVLIIIQAVYLIQLFFVKPYLDAIHMIVDFLIQTINLIVICFMFVFLTAFDASSTPKLVLAVGVAVLLLVAMIVAISGFIDSWLKLRSIYTWAQLVDRVRGRTGEVSDINSGDQDLELQGTRKAD